MSKSTLNDSLIAVAKTVIGKKSLKEIDKMKGLDFEVFIGELLTQHGYKTQNIKGSGDFGVDVIAEKNGTKYAVQVKRYKSNVSRTAISDAVAGKFHWDCEKAWVITNSYFTSDAKLLATSTDCKLTDRDELKRMMKDGSTFASIFEGGADKKRKGPSIWTTLLLIGIAALGFYAIRFIPEDSVKQFWQSTTALFSTNSSTNSSEDNDSNITPLVPDEPSPDLLTPVDSIDSTTAPTVPSGLRPVVSDSLSTTNDTVSPIILDSGDSLRPTPVIGSSPITELNPSTLPDQNTTDLQPLETDPASNTSE